jgi:hypothetical protein
MAKYGQITVYDLAVSLFDRLEVEAITQQSEARAFREIEQSAYTDNQLRYAQYQLSTIRKLRCRIPAAWKRAYITED